MCLFPLPNCNFSGLAYKKGIKEFSCGSCPECLRKRSSVWALRAVYEARSHLYNCMITLTYDTFKYSGSPSLEENPVDPTIEVNKRHIQLFIKRLRKWYSTISSEPIKYLCCAEYGSRTHRAHYHLILFGVRFPDIIKYKRSKRNNIIYRSAILDKLWGHGICSVDSININGAAAAYCTKYTAKSRSDDTFMLCSQHIGLSELLKDFNGRSYVIEGREYPIPRAVWQVFITTKYNSKPAYRGRFDFRYVNHNPELYNNAFADDTLYKKFSHLRKMYRFIRDRDPLYIGYLEYWKTRGEQFNSILPPIKTRILLLDDGKFHTYKTRALEVLSMRYRFIPYPAPGSNCISAYEKWKLSAVPVSAPRFTCPIPPCHNRASDTKKINLCPFDGEIYSNIEKFEPINHFLLSKVLTSSSVQLIM